MSYGLGFITDEDIFTLVRDTILRYRRSIDLKEFNQNIVDPIKLTFDMKVYGKSAKDMVLDECLRQIDKSNTNHIGYFHQNLFRFVGKGWHVPDAGFDIVNESRHIYVELKNKHNTMNSNSAQKVYEKMQRQLLKDDKATCYLVEVVSRRSCDEKWTMGEFSHERIRRISADRFFSIAFDDSHAFYNLCQQLPRVIDDVISSKSQALKIENLVLPELANLSTDILQSLFLLAFPTYLGFSDANTDIE